jgi:L,D-transpeptidase catalytic domain
MAKVRWIVTTASFLALTSVAAFNFRYPTSFQPTYRERSQGCDVVAAAHQQSEFLKSRGFNERYLFVADMCRTSGRNRFFVIDLKKDSIIDQGIVAHGSGGAVFAPTPRFSNAVESNCTSLGRYVIGQSYPGRFGKAYRLKGLDTSNSNALKRNVVLHQYGGLPEAEVFPMPIANSLGCPMVPKAFFRRLEKIIDHSQKPVLLQIIN